MGAFGSGNRVSAIAVIGCGEDVDTARARYCYPDSAMESIETREIGIRLMRKVCL